MVGGTWTVGFWKVIHRDAALVLFRPFYMATWAEAGVDRSVDAAR